MYKKPFFLFTSFSALHAANPFVHFFIILFIDVAQGTQFHLDWSIASSIYGSKHGPPHFKLSRIVFHFFFWRQLIFFSLLLLRLQQDLLGLVRGLQHTATTILCSALRHSPAARLISGTSRPHLLPFLLFLCCCLLHCPLLGTTACAGIPYVDMLTLTETIPIMQWISMGPATEIASIDVI